MAERPLRVEELAEILAYDLDVAHGAADGEMPTYHAEWRWEDQEQAVLSACSSLISIVDSEGSRVVQFSHFSVKEFLTSKRLATAAGELSQYHILFEPAHTIMTQACLAVLLRLNDSVDEQSAKKIPLAEYAAGHWVSHAQVENVMAHVQHAMETLFDSEKPHFLAWLRVHCVDPPQRFRWVDYPPGGWVRGCGRLRTHRSQQRRIRVEIPRVYAEPLYYSSLYGFYNLVEQLVIKNPQHVNAVGGNHGSPLLAALWEKHVRVAELLLEHGANINIKGPKNDTPLHKAIGWSEDPGLDAMQFLLKHGADVNARQDDLSTPLHLAASEGRFKAAQLLLANKANVDFRDTAGKAPLHLVSSVANRPDLRPRLAQLLLEYSADVNSKDEDDATPLHYASEYQRQDIAQILLAHGAKADAKNNKLMTPLHLSLLSQYYRPCSIDFVQFLLENGAEVNAQDENYETALHLAFGGGRHDIAQMLLERGAKVNATNNRGETLLHQVSKGEDDCVTAVQLLLELGADVNAQDNDHITPLHLASENGRLEIARALLDHGAKVSAENNRGETPLHRLSRGNVGECLRVARLLLERGADINARANGQATPLHLASDDGFFDVAQILVSCGANVNVKNSQDQTPLFLLLERSRHSLISLDFIRLLVEYGADANTRSEDNTTPLHLASKHGEVEVARVLLNHGAIVDAKDNRGWSPIHQSVTADNWVGSDRLAVARLLLENNVDVNAQDENHETPLHLACNLGRLDFALVLMDHSAIVDAKNKQGRTPLHDISCGNSNTRFGLKDIVQVLLERGANANARDEDNATPLHLACSGSVLELVPVLLDGGANPSAKDNLGQTPLHRLLRKSCVCTREDCLVFVHLLLKHGVDINAEDEGGATALHLAFNHYEPEVGPVLLAHGANPNAENNLGETPLHRLLRYYSCQGDCHLDKVQLTLEHGANPNAQDKDGITLLQLSSRHGMPEVTRLLLRHGAKVTTESDEDCVPLHVDDVSSNIIPVPRS